MRAPAHDERRPMPAAPPRHRCASSLEVDEPLRLWAISDLHVSHRGNWEALKHIPAHPDDWLILAGDISDGARQLDRCFRHLCTKFRQIVWTPGNHELWSHGGAAGGLRGVALYERLVEDCAQLRRAHAGGPLADLPASQRGPLLIAPLFLLYDYSFRPSHVSADQVVEWASVANSVCADEILLHPDPFPGPRVVVHLALPGCGGPARIVPHRYSEGADQPLSARRGAGGAAPHPALLPVVRHPADAGLAPALQRLRGNLRAPPHPRNHLAGRSPLPGSLARLSEPVGRRTGDRHLPAGSHSGPSLISLDMSAPENKWWTPWREVDGVTRTSISTSRPMRNAKPSPSNCSTTTRRRAGAASWWNVPSASSRFAGGALRIHLAERLGSSNHEISFGYLQHGKPFVKVRGHRAPIGFNVSHSGRHGLIAFAEHDWLGVDVEERVPKSDLDGIGDRGVRPLGTGDAPGRRRSTEGARLLSPVEHEGGADKGPRHGLLPESVALRSARSDPARGIFERLPLPPLPRKSLAAPRSWESPDSRPPWPGGCPLGDPRKAVDTPCGKYAVPGRGFVADENRAVREEPVRRNVGRLRRVVLIHDIRVTRKQPPSPRHTTIDVTLRRHGFFAPSRPQEARGAGRRSAVSPTD